LLVGREKQTAFAKKREMAGIGAKEKPKGTLIGKNDNGRTN